MRIIETKVYKFDELSDEAKEKARDWWKEASIGDEFGAECVYEDAAQCGKIIGIEINPKNQKCSMTDGSREWIDTNPAIYWSGFSNQGDGACFEGEYAYAKGGAKKIRDHAPKDTKLHRIADALQEAQRKVNYTATASTKQRGHYCHSGCMEVVVDVEHTYISEPDEKKFDERFCNAEAAITQCMRDFADWIYKRLEEDYEWRMKDEQVDENITANEYEFTEDGKIA